MNKITPQQILDTYTIFSMEEGTAGSREINIQKYKLEKLDENFLDRMNGLMDAINQLSLEISEEEKKGKLRVIQADLADFQGELEGRIKDISSKIFLFKVLLSIVNRTEKKAIKQAHQITKGLEEQLIQLDNTAVSHFFRDNTIKDKMKGVSKDLLAPIINRLAFRIRREIFGGWTEAEQYALMKLEKKYSKLDRPLIEMREEKAELEVILKCQKAARLGKELDIAFKNVKPILDQHLPDTTLALSPDYQEYKRIERNYNKINSELALLTLPKDLEYSGTAFEIEALEERINELDEEMNSYSQEVGIDDIRDKIQELKAHTSQKREKIKKRLEKIGGERARIVDEKSHSVLDGMYFSADKFRESLNTSGVIFAYIQVNDTQTVNGFLVEKGDEQGDKTLSLLEKLGLYDCYQDVKLGNALFICPKDQAEAVNKALDRKEEIKEISFDKTHTAAGGTVLLTQGNGGIYEVYDWEILAFLLRGMNVFTANFAGFGDSTGVPSESTLKSNMNAIYHHLQATHPVEDSHLLIKGLCMSGGLAAYLAAKHPRANLFLDQTYANFKKFVHDEIKAGINHFIATYHEDHPNESFKKQLVLWSAKQLKGLSRVAKIVAPAWETQKEIAKVQGHIAILSTKDDERISEDHIQANLKAAAPYQKVTHIKMTGGHADAWVETEEDGPLVPMQNEKGFRIPDQKKAAEIIYEFEERVAENKGLNSLLESIWRKCSRNFPQKVTGDSIFESMWNFFQKQGGLNKRDFSWLIKEEENFYLTYISDQEIKEQTQALLREFLTAIFGVDIERILRNPLNEQNRLRSGREQVDEFLKNAGLMGNIFV